MGEQGQDENSDAHEVIATAHAASESIEVALRRIWRLAVMTALVVVVMVAVGLAVNISIGNSVHTVQQTGTKRSQKILRVVTSHDGKLNAVLGVGCELIESDSSLLTPKVCLPPAKKADG